MYYADQACKRIESHPTFGEHTYTFKGHCVICETLVKVDVLGKELFQYRHGKAIQDALTSNTDDEREFLMTGICGKCFEILCDEAEQEMEEEAKQQED